MSASRRHLVPISRHRLATPSRRHLADQPSLVVRRQVRQRPTLDNSSWDDVLRGYYVAFGLDDGVEYDK